MPINPNARSRSPPSTGSRRSHTGWCATCACAGRWRKSGSTTGSRLLGGDRARPTMSTSSRSTRSRASATEPVKIFESGAIVQYIGEKSEACCQRTRKARYRAIQWSYAALNSVEPAS